MKKLMTLGALLAAACALAAEKRNVPYYEDGAPMTGDVEYLKERCVLDLHTPDGVKDFATLVWFHGGGITGGQKHYPKGIDKSRFAVAAVNYRLSGKRAKCPDYLYDSAAAVAWVLKHIGEHGGDPKKVYVSGMSAGGYLSAMVALAPKYLEAFGCSADDLAAVFPVSGQMTTHFQVLNERRAVDASTPTIFIDEYSPIGNARKGAPPMILFAGDTKYEWPARLEENQLLEARLRRNFDDARVRVYSIGTCSHGTVCDPSLAIVNSILRGSANPWSDKKRK